MRRIDASNGGGQLVRWALGLAAVDGEVVELSGIRADRPNPGLRPQHLAVVRALGEVTSATVEGAREGSGTLSFDPDGIASGEYGVAVGTAGSVALVFDAVLTLAPVLDGPLAVTATGGTDVKWSPPIDYLRRVKLPLLRTAGVHAALEVHRRGFYPEGGGRATLWVAPTPGDPCLELDEPEGGEFGPARIYSTATEDLAEADVGTRQADAARERLAEAGIDVTESVVSVVDARSTGSAVVVHLHGPAAPAGFDRLGEPGTPAEEVGESAADAAVEFPEGPGAVDRHMGDQLVPFLALGSGRVPIPAVTDHVETGVELAREFGHDVRIEDGDGGPVLVGDHR